MKHVANTPIPGYKDEELTLGDRSFTPLELFRSILRAPLPPESQTRRVTVADVEHKLRILEALDPQDNTDYVDIGDSDWDFIRPLIEYTLLHNPFFQLHTPAVLSTLDTRVNEGKPETRAEKRRQQKDAVAEVL